MKKWQIVLIIVVATSLQSVQAELVLHYNFDRVDPANPFVLDTGTVPLATGLLGGNASRIANTPGDLSFRALDLTANGANQNYAYALSDADKVDALSSMTLTMWINLQGDPLDGDGLLSDLPETFPIPPAGTGGWDWSIDTGPSQVNPMADNFAMRFGMSSSTGSSGGFQSQGSMYSLNADNRWIFLAVTYNGPNSNQIIFYDGSETSTVAQHGMTGFATFS